MSSDQYWHAMALRLLLVVVLIILLAGCAFDACNQPHIKGVPGCHEPARAIPYENMCLGRYS